MLAAAEHWVFLFVCFCGLVLDQAKSESIKIPKGMTFF